MEPRELAATYDKIARHWAHDTFKTDNGIHAHERALQFARGTGAAIDIGCGGNGRFIELLLTRGYAVEGLDISPAMLTLARARHPGVQFHQADICAWSFPRRYDFISAWDSIWHVPLDRQPGVLEKLCRGLNPGGVMIFTTGGVDTPGEVTNPCHGEPLYHAAPGIPQVLRTVERGGCVCRHLEYDQWPESHLYLIVQRPADEKAEAPAP